jgi:hypothetical protein
MQSLLERGVRAVWVVSVLLAACAGAPDAADGGRVSDAAGGQQADDLDAAAPDTRHDAGGRPQRGRDAAALDGRDATLPDAATAATDAAPELDAAGLPALEDLPYARAVVSFSPGASAGFGQGKLPDIVLGPPQGGGLRGGSLDVVSLGVGGTIVLDFGARGIVDAPGVDFLVFENAFWPNGVETQVFAEVAEVSVSEDGSTWQTFPCDADGTPSGVYAGCAGWHPTLDYDAQRVVPLDPALTGGDPFDLAQLGVTHARYVRVHDLAQGGTGNSAGFDLDAVGLVHHDGGD